MRAVLVLAGLVILVSRSFTKTTRVAKESRADRRLYEVDAIGIGGTG
jgi:hypothetical protein